MKYDPVGAALRRRKDAGVCLVCGGELVDVKKLGKVCINKDDGRHMGPARKKIRMKQVKLQAPKV
jgi:hypothetical protein